MDQIFQVGRRFRLLKGLCVAANLLVVMTFYFIYRYLLQTSHPDFADLPLLLIFVAVGALVVKLTLLFAGRYAQSVQYRVSGKELVVGSGKLARRYPWDRFQSVRLNTYRSGAILPLLFQVGEDTLELNQQIGDLYGLAASIFKHIAPYVSVDEDLRRQVGAMQHTF